MTKTDKSFKRLLQVIGKYKFTLFMTMICAFLSSTAAVFTTFFIGSAIDEMKDFNDVNFQLLYQKLFILIALYVAVAVFQWLVTVLANRTAYNTARDLRSMAFAKLNRLPLSFFDNNPHGDLISRFTNDIDNISDALALSIVNLFSSIVIVASSLIVMFSLNLKITLTILLVTPLCFVVAYLVTRFSQNNFKKQQAITGELSSFVSEMVGNQKIVTAFGYEEHSIERFKEINNRLLVIGTKAQFASALVNPSIRFVDHVSYVLVGIVGGVIAVTTGVSVGVVSSFLIYSAQFSKPFNEISSIMTNIQTAFASLSRIFALLDQEEEIKDASDAVDLINPNDIQFEDVCFSYSKNKKLLENLSFLAKSGNIIAIVGPTGAGKTTIVNLLMRFYEIDEGHISIDGININTIKKSSLRRNFGMVLQDTWLFSGTIRENLSYGMADATLEEIILAAKKAHAHSFIMQLDKGYDSFITEDGGNLSVGQKQLLTIGRVMLANPKMLILDEATSSIDTLTEIRIQKAFLKMMEGRTSFVIAHRLSTIVSADLILVLDKGNIVESGSHKELLGQNGFYANLYNSQFE